MKVFLNPGHAPNGNPDPGAVNGETGLRECDVALAVGESAESYLNAAGVETELLQSDSLYDICEAANSSDAGVNGLYVLTNTDMPAVLVELAFITNPGDEEILANAQDAMARAVARGVTDYEQLILGGK